MYDSAVHVRVRVLHHKVLPVDFLKCRVTNVEQDTKSVYLKPSTYTGKIESAKVTLNEIWNSVNKKTKLEHPENVQLLK